MRPRPRTLLIAAGLLVLALIAGALIAVHILLKPARFTALLESAASSAGLTLRLQQPASFELFPRPALALAGFSLSVSGHGTPLLSAARGRLRVPWRAMLGGTPTITRLELDAPRLDLGELGRYVATLPTGRAPFLPRIGAGIRLRDGSVINQGRMLLTAVSLDTGPLAPGRPFILRFAARDSHGAALALTLDALPRSTPTLVSLQPLTLRGSGHTPVRFALDGSAGWLGGSRFNLHLAGRFTDAGATSRTLDLQLGDDGVAPMQARIAINGSGEKLQASLQPSALLAWWATLRDSAANAPLTLPPLTAAAEIRHYQVGGVSIEGLSVSSDPAAAGSAVPARAASTRAR